MGSVLHGFLSGTALVGAILVISSWLFFWAIGLDFPFLAGLVSGLSSLVPYFGAVSYTHLLRMRHVNDPQRQLLQVRQLRQHLRLQLANQHFQSPKGREPHNRFAPLLLVLQSHNPVVTPPLWLWI